MNLKPPYLQQLSRNVHTYVQPDGSWCLNNAGIVLGAEETLLVDTTSTEKRALALKEAVSSLTPAPVRQIAVTHHHGDHTNGNSVFAAEATFVGHELCPEQLMAHAGLTEQVWPYVDWGEIPPTPPTRTFSEHTTLTCGDTRVELLHLAPGHTVEDIVVHLPDQGVLFTGDVVFNHGTPFILMGSLAGSLAAIGAMRELGAETVVPGHGPVAGPELFDETERYLTWVAGLAEHGRARGLTPLDVARQAELGEFADWTCPERLVANLYRAYAEVDDAPLGAPVDEAAAIADIFAICDDEMPHCFA